MAEEKSIVSFAKTEDRKAGVESALGGLGVNPVKNKAVLIKPNFNTADIAPGSTHNDTLVALVEKIWSMGAKSISLGDRSYTLTREVMEQKGVPALMQERDVSIVDFDNLDSKDWVKVTSKDSHWRDGFRVARRKSALDHRSQPARKWRDATRGKKAAQPRRTRKDDRRNQRSA